MQKGPTLLNRETVLSGDCSTLPSLTRRNSHDFGSLLIILEASGCVCVCGTVHVKTCGLDSDTINLG